MKKIGKVFYWIISIALKIFAVIAGVNLIFSYIGDRKRGPLPENGKFYDWKFGRVFYRKRGYGAPVLLLHGFEPSHSSKDLESLSKYLADKHTVYSVDLLGFGFSDKPWITYTNFLYVQLIQDFIKNVIGEITDVVACDGSALTALQAYHFDESRLGKIVLIDPCRSENLKAAKPFALKLKSVLDFPIFGTFLYNIYSLTGAAPFDKEGRHVFASRLTGHLTSDISKRPELLKPEIIVFGDPAKEPKTFTYGDIGTSLM
jgi:pimeloyl-ACP methyl ester carboxylesterase